MDKKIWITGLVILAAGCVAPTTQRMQIDDALVALEARKQREIALQSLAETERRLFNVAYELQVAAHTLCGEKVKPSLGVRFVNKYAFPEDMRETAVALYAVGEALQVQILPTGSPAAVAGLRERDVLVAINDKMIPVGKEASEKFSELLDESAKDSKPVALRIVRNDSQQVVSVMPKKTCAFPVVLQPSDEVNAYADGERVIITQGMIRFANNDTELGLVVAHELAHNAMEHIGAKKTNWVLGTILDILAAGYGVDTQGGFGNVAAQAYSQDFEAEADYVGMYVMALAGRDIGNAAYFWRRMAAVHPGSIKKNHAASHPATPERFLALEKTVVEIRNKQKLSLPLVPEKKKEEKEQSQPANN